MNRSQVATLEASGLITLAAVQPELEYAFRHSMVQEVAYRSLTHASRQELHLQVGSTLEEIYPDRLDELAPLLAEHFLEAGEKTRALQYFIRAGKAAQRIYANAEAVLLYRKALRIARDHPQNYGLQAGQEQLADLYLCLGRVLELTAQFEQAAELYGEMEQDARQHGDMHLELASLLARLTLLSIPTPLFNPEQAARLSAHALDLAGRLGDRASEAKIWWNRMQIGYFTGQNEEAREVGERAMAIARELGQKEQIAYIANDLANYVYKPAAEFERELALLNEARQLWLEVGNMPMLIDTLSTLAQTHAMLGRLDTSRQLAEEAYQLAEHTGNQWGQAYSLMMSSIPMSFSGQMSRAIHTMDRSIEIGAKAHFITARSIPSTMEAYIYASLGKIDRAQELAQASIKNSENGATFWAAHALGSLAFVRIKLGDLTGAKELLDQAMQMRSENELFLYTSTLPNAVFDLYAIQGDYAGLLTHASGYTRYLRQHKADAYLPLALHYLGLACQNTGQIDQALSELRESVQLARQMGVTYFLWRTLLALSDLERQLGDPAAAETRRQAREEASLIAVNIDDPDLRSTFLALPDVAALLEGG